MWRRRPLFQNLSPSSRAVGPGRKKGSTIPVAFRQEGEMFRLPFHFVRDAQELKTQLFPLSSRCVRIAAAGAR